MKATNIIIVIVVLLGLGAAFLYFQTISKSASLQVREQTDGSNTPSQAMGTNGSPNQGNLGGAGGDTPQQP